MPKEKLQEKDCWCHKSGIKHNESHVIDFKPITTDQKPKYNSFKELLKEKHEVSGGYLMFCFLTQYLLGLFILRSILMLFN
jgi:hypothetical protein